MLDLMRCHGREDAHLLLHTTQNGTRMYRGGQLAMSATTLPRVGGSRSGEQAATHQRPYRKQEPRPVT